MIERIRKAYPLNPPKAHKYHARRTDGYASAREAKRATELRLLERAGKIAELREQVKFELLPAAKELGYPRPLTYIADFIYIDWPRTRAATSVVEDSKGVRTPVYRLKKRLMKQLMGINITEV